MYIKLAVIAPTLDPQCSYVAPLPVKQGRFFTDTLIVFRNRVQIKTKPKAYPTFTSAPAASAITARHISDTNHSSLLALELRILRQCGPITTPVSK